MNMRPYGIFNITSICQIAKPFKMNKNGFNVIKGQWTVMSLIFRCQTEMLCSRHCSTWLR